MTMEYWDWHGNDWRFGSMVNDMHMEQLGKRDSGFDHELVKVLSVLLVRFNVTFAYMYFSKLIICHGEIIDST